MHTLDPRNPAAIESFLAAKAIAHRRRSGDTPDSVEHVDTDQGAHLPRTKLASFDVDGDNHPYRSHCVTFNRGASGRLHVCIESYLAFDRSGNPGRIEMGPVAKVVRALARIGLTPAELGTRKVLPRIEDWFEFRDQFSIGVMAIGLENVLGTKPTGRVLPADVVEG